MLQKDTPREHLNLIRRVERIDKEAAVYMKSRLKEYKKGEADYNTVNSLNACFVFDLTPQGFKYWDKIMTAMGKW